ncbi:hypothetical protein [Caloramator proteoclasticus]|uniref:Uncharacterized protein n=1 Tax=Caloramator proteoclasticus DSM 10124 TaxID=1121262 RepID=A0A1M4UMP0_9CLOT|nr:hypothetical protein [Caloramator proteoclasticus]SHE57989.1 hypothetical protein SAMN02746091_00698 [Caloramator proteoclasticus DSM 10124]
MSNQITVIQNESNLKRLNDLYTDAVLDIIKSRLPSNPNEIEYLIQLLKACSNLEEQL